MGKRILILDDDADFNNLLTDIFSQADYDVTSERDPEAAVDILLQSDYDLVVTDQKMPGLSGEEFIREVKTTKPDIPIIMVSGYLDNDTIRRLIKEGVGGVFLKPLNVFSLLKRTAALIEARDAAFLRKNGQADDGLAPLEIEEFKHSLPFSFHSLPCKAPQSQEFAKKLYSLRNFKTNLIIIAPSGSDLQAYLLDLGEFSEPGLEYFKYVESYSLSEEVVASGIEEAAKEGASRYTVIIQHAERLNVDQKKVVFGASSKEPPFDAMTLPLRFIFHVPEDLDDLYDKGEIDDDLYMFMGTSEVKAPSLNEIREDVPLLANRMLIEHGDEQSISPIPVLEPPARVFLRDYDWKGNTAELKRFVEAMLEQGARTISRDELQVIASDIRSSGQSKSFNIRFELENFRDDLVKAAMRLGKGSSASASDILGLDKSLIDEVSKKLTKGTT